MKALKKMMFAVAFVLTLGLAGTVSAVTFDFNSLSNNANATSISTYMSSVYGSPVSVSGHSVTAERSLWGLLGPDTYIESEPFGSHEITITFTKAIQSVAFDYAALLDEFVADANGQQFFSTSYNLLKKGHFSMNFAAPITVLSFHDGGIGEVGIDNLRVTAVPEPSTMLLLSAGCLGLAIFGKRRSAMQTML